MQKLKEKGQYYELPIEGYKIKKMLFSGIMHIIFDDKHESYLDFCYEFKIQKYNQTNVLKSNTFETLALFYDLWNEQTAIKEAKADKEGFLFLTFENGFEISVENQPCNNWQFTTRDAENKNNNVSAYNCCGSVCF